MALLRAMQLTIASSRAGRRRQPLLSGLDLSVDPGSCWLLTGAHGAGKTRLLSVLAGLAPALAGEVTVLDHPVGSRAAARALGFAREDADWPAGLCVEDALIELASVAGMQQLGERIGRALQPTGLGDARRRRVEELSSGQRRLLAVAQALLDEPPLLLLDGVLDALDAASQRSVQAALAERLDEGAAVLLATQHPELFAGLATHELALPAGELRALRPDALPALDPAAAPSAEGGAG